MSGLMSSLIPLKEFNTLIKLKILSQLLFNGRLKRVFFVKSQCEESGLILLMSLCILMPYIEGVGKLFLQPEGYSTH